VLYAGRRILALGLLVAATACGGGAKGGATSTTTTAGAATSSSVLVGATTTSAGPLGTTTSGARAVGGQDVRDWDGVRFDIGVLDRIDRTEDGRTLVVFDRMQLEGPGGRRSGRDLTSEPIVFGNTDAPLVNDTPKLRTYVARPGMEVLRLGNLRQTCTDLPHPAAPQWVPETVDRVVDQSLWKDYRQVSLTFSPDGQVSRLRLSSGC
jgi:hypothetical protein